MTSVFHAWGLLYRMNRIHDCLLPNDATGDCRARAIQLDMWRLSESGVLDLPVLAASSAKASVLEALSRFKTGVDKGTFPRPIVLARLISALGRLGETQKIAEVYDASQADLLSMESMKQWQTSETRGKVPAAREKMTRSARTRICSRMRFSQREVPARATLADLRRVI